MTTNPPTWLKVEEALEYMRVGKTKFYEIMDQLTTRKLGRTRLILRASVDDFFTSLPSAKGKPPSAKIKCNPALALLGLERRRVPPTT